MAFPSGITVTAANSGLTSNRTDSVSVACSTRHTGRVVRNIGKITITPSGGGSAKEVTLKQAAAAEAITIASNVTGRPASGETYTITGTSNSSGLTFTTTGGGTLAASYSAATVSATTNGAAITGDPGSASTYNWSMKLTIPVNNDAAIKTYTVTAKSISNASVTKSIEIKQSAAAVTFNVSPTELTFAATGETKTVTVTTNTSYTVS